MNLGDRFEDVGLVLVEYHSYGRVADVAHWAIELGCAVSVTDNSSTYGGPGQVIRPDENLGFGAACNRAVEALPSSARIVVLHNPDVHIEPTALADLVALVRDGELDAVAPAVMGATKRPLGFRYPSAWREPVLCVVDMLRLRSPGSHPRFATGSTPSGFARVVREPGRFGTAALLVLRRSAFEHVGGFDGRFFLYGEDLDLWHRLAARGHDVGFAPGLEAHHDEGQGSASDTTSRTVLRWLSRELFADLHGGGWRRYRLVHRLAAASLPDHATVRAMRSAFAAGAGPAEAIAAVRWGKTPVGSA